MPKEFLWSEWGVPDVLCGIGTQKRTTMCGSLRRILPNIPGRDSDQPAIYWPDCLVNKRNVAPEGKEDAGASTLEDCFTNCRGNADCDHWTFDVKDKKCQHFAVYKFEDKVDLSVVSGSKYCTGKCKCCFLPEKRLMQKKVRLGEKIPYLFRIS